MFTGIVKDCGEVVVVEPQGGKLQVQILTQLPDEHFRKGASIAVDGACLTVENYENGVFTVTLVEESLAKTKHSELQAGQKVNLEPPLTLQSPLDGHLVSGHVDAVAKVLQAGEDFELQIPEEFLKFCAPKGSITVNGVSLTIAGLQEDRLRIALIPETLRATNLGELAAGDLVNIEVDLIARTLEHLNRYS